MSGYGKIKSLEEILQELVTYCACNTGEKIELKVHLPKSILGKFSQSYTPIPKMVLSGDSDNSVMNIGKIYLQNGTVELES